MDVYISQCRMYFECIAILLLFRLWYWRNKIIFMESNQKLSAVDPVTGEAAYDATASGIYA